MIRPLTEFFDPPAPVRSDYEFVRHTDTHTHIATVTLDIEADDMDVVVFSRAALQQFHRVSQTQRYWYSQWIAAAKSGARASAIHLTRTRVIPGCKITVLSIIGSTPNTTLNAVFCAASLAAWQGLNPQQPLPEVDLIDGRYVPYLEPSPTVKST